MEVIDINSSEKTTIEANPKQGKILRVIYMPKDESNDKESSYFFSYKPDIDSSTIKHCIVGSGALFNELIELSEKYNFDSLLDKLYGLTHNESIISMRKTDMNDIIDEYTSLLIMDELNQEYYKIDESGAIIPDSKESADEFNEILVSIIEEMKPAVNEFILFIDEFNRAANILKNLTSYTTNSDEFDEMMDMVKETNPDVKDEDMDFLKQLFKEKLSDSNNYLQ